MATSRMYRGRDGELCVRLQSVLIRLLGGACGFFTGRMYRHAYLGLLPSPELKMHSKCFFAP